MKIFVPKETAEKENRVALIPAGIKKIAKAGIEIRVECGAGKNSSIEDSAYEEAGAKITNDKRFAYAEADIIAKVQKPSVEEISMMKDGALVICHLNPLGQPDIASQLAEKNISGFSVELIPRITRAQSMDVLSSMASIAGYKAVLMAADMLGKYFPMLMTAAGTVAPARVLVLGAGVAGLQAIATAKRLGAVVEAFDVRPAVKEQVQSLGAKFLEVATGTGEQKISAEGEGGYAKELSAEQHKLELELIGKQIKKSDVVISTAAIPGRRAPVLITEEMVKTMQPGSVIVDLAAETGGNCEITEANKTVVKYGVNIVGTTNVASLLPVHASQLYSKNIENILSVFITKEGNLNIDLNDEIVKGALVTHNREVIHPAIKKLINVIV